MRTTTAASSRFHTATRNGSLTDAILTKDRLIYLLTFAPIVLLLIISTAQTYVPLAYLTKDPLTVAEMAPADCCSVYYGALSNLGILLWCATSAVCLFAALTLWLGREAASFARNLMPAFLAAGAFSGWLMLDDLFLVHENVLPALGIPQKVVYGIYGCLTAMYIWLARNIILAGRSIMFLAAIGLLSMSVAVDVVAISENFNHVLIEDGAKIMGIAAWTAFHIEAATITLLAFLSGKNSASEPLRYRLQGVVQKPL